MTRMRATLVPEKGTIVCDETDVIAPEAGQVLVRSHYAAICGSDLHSLFHGMPLPPFHATKPGFPGHEGVGEVLESRHPDWQPGDRVLCCPAHPNPTGCFADYQTIHGHYLVRLPETDVPEEHLLMAQQFGTTIFSLRQFPADVMGKTVLVMGQGSAGLFFASSLKRAGARKVIASDLSEARLALSHKFGVDVAVKAEGDNVQQTVLEETDGQGVDYLVEAVGKADAQRDSMGMIKFRGHGLYFGQPDTQEHIPLNFFAFQRQQLTLQAPGGAQHEGDLVSFKEALRRIATREVDVSDLVSHVYPLEQVAEAMRVAETREDNARKVVLKI